MFNFINETDGFPLFFAGYYSKRINNYFDERNCLRLHSYAIEKKGILERVNKGLKTFVDSGAFTAMNKGIQLDIDEYIDFLNQYEEHFLLYCQFDTIPVGDITGEESAKATKENYWYMRSKLKNPDKLLYCFHCGEDFKYLEDILNDPIQIPYIAFGGLAKKGKKTREEFLNKAFEVIKNSKNPNVKVHAFGVTDFDILERYPFTSADSTSWLWGGVFGRIISKYGKFLISDRKPDDKKHIENQSEELQALIKEEIKSVGLDYEKMKTIQDERNQFNILSFIKWAKSYKPKH